MNQREREFEELLDHLPEGAEPIRLPDGSWGYHFPKQTPGNRLTPTPLDQMDVLPEMRVFDPNEDGAD